MYLFGTLFPSSSVCAPPRTLWCVLWAALRLFVPGVCLRLVSTTPAFNHPCYFLSLNGSWCPKDTYHATVPYWRPPFHRCRWRAGDETMSVHFHDVVILPATLRHYLDTRQRRRLSPAHKLTAVHTITHVPLSFPSLITFEGAVTPLGMLPFT